MSQSSRSPSRERERSPRDRKIRTERYMYRDAPYRRDGYRGSRITLGNVVLKAPRRNGVVHGHLGHLDVGEARQSFDVAGDDCGGNCSHRQGVLRGEEVKVEKRTSDSRLPRSELCKNCKRPGHYARECPNIAVCNNCGLPGHIAAECTQKALCWNCKEPGHMASNCPNEGICHTCGKAGHIARDCSIPAAPPGDMRLCNNCYKQGHVAADCTNEKACNNCRKTGHLARDCQNEPVCNLCNISGHVARQCPKSEVLGDRGVGGGFHRGDGGFQRDVVCRNCNQMGHMSRDCMGPMMICHNCGGRGHLAYECPSGRFIDRGMRRY